MARAIGRMTALAVARATKPGMYADGAGLYLRVTPQGTKNWVFRYMLHGKPRWMGLGPLHTISLSEARLRAAERRRERLDGIDPIENRRAQRQQAQLEASRSITFSECAAQYVDAHGAGWRNAKHANQWSATLTTYANPIIGGLSIQSIDTGLVMRVLEPIWKAKPETASRLRGRIESILDWARVRGYRVGENPARWRGHLDKLLPARSKVRRVKHHAAMPYSDVPAFMAELRAADGVAARALEIAVLTAARTGEVLGMRWADIDQLGRVWTVPAERMKAGKEHKVPLSRRALAVLESQGNGQSERPESDFVFSGAKSGKPLSNMAFLMLLRRMGHANLTAHGFRSSFRDWVAERTGYSPEVAEMALAHAVANKVEAAYRRGDMFEKRRRLMEEWSTFCSTPPSRTQSSRVLNLRPSGQVSSRAD